MPPDARLLREIAALVVRHCGIVLPEEKDYFLAARLEGLAKSRGLASVEDLYEREIRGRPGLAAIQRVIDAVVIGETSFFRDPASFDLLAGELLRREGDVSRPLRIWSAACATGQEPYSIAMQVCVSTPHLAARTRILATDISTPFLARARQGRYSKSGARGPWKERAGCHLVERDGGLDVPERVRRMVTFERHNLKESYLRFGRFDFLFCRNVLIYFDDAQRRDVLARLRDALEPGGLLFLGLTECVLELPPGLDRVTRGAAVGYRRA